MTGLPGGGFTVVDPVLGRLWLAPSEDVAARLIAQGGNRWRVMTAAELAALEPLLDLRAEASGPERAPDGGEMPADEELRAAVEYILSGTPRTLWGFGWLWQAMFAVELAHIRRWLDERLRARCWWLYRQAKPVLLELYGKNRYQPARAEPAMGAGAETLLDGIALTSPGERWHETPPPWSYMVAPEGFAHAWWAMNELELARRRGQLDAVDYRERRRRFDLLQEEVRQRFGDEALLEAIERRDPRRPLGP